MIFLKYGKGKVSELLHSMFSDEAIESTALSVMIEDTKYLIKHNIIDDHKKQKEMYDKSIALGDKDNGRTYNKKNIQEFRNELKQLESTGKIKSIYEGLSEIELYALLGLFYDD